MMTPRLEKIWEETCEEQRFLAETNARIVLEYLIHYKTGGHYREDVQLLAAEMLHFQKHGGGK